MVVRGVERIIEMTHQAKAKAVQPIDEMADALRALVVSHETDGGRDRPEVVKAREVLAKHDASEDNGRSR